MYGVPVIDPYACERIPTDQMYYQPAHNFMVPPSQVTPVPPPPRVRSNLGVDRFQDVRDTDRTSHSDVRDRERNSHSDVRDKERRSHSDRRDRDRDRKVSPPRRNSRESRHSPGKRSNWSPPKRPSRERDRNTRDNPRRNDRGRSRSPLKQYPLSPGRKISHSPARKISRSPMRKISRSPVKQFSRSPPRKRPPIERDEELEALVNIPGEIRVRNLPPFTRQREVDALFEWNIGDVTYCEVMENGTKAFVKFKTLDLARKAAEKMQGYKFNEHLIQVSETTMDARVKLEALQLKSNSNADKPVLDWGYTYGLTTSFLESLRIIPPLVSTVLVENLDPTVIPYKLTEVFNMAGRVRHVAMTYDSQGRSKGEARVEFEHPVEAIQAISMLHDQIFLDRRLRVIMYHEPPPDKLKFPDGLQGVGLGLGINGAPLKNIPQLLKTAEEKKNREKDREEDRRSVIDITEEDDFKSHHNVNYQGRGPKPVPSVPLPPLAVAPLVPVKEPENNVLQIACTPEGVDILSQKIATGSNEELASIFQQVVSDIMRIVTDIHGSRVVIKLIELGSSMQRQVIVNLLKTKGPGYKGLSQHKFAHKVVVKTIEVCPLPLQLVVLAELKGHSLFLSKNIHGRHVIEACLSVMGCNYVLFIIEEVKGHVVEMLRDMDGILVIKKILLQLPQELSGPIFTEILANAPTIITDSCGVKIIHTLLDNGHLSDTYHVIQALRGVFIFLAQKSHCFPILSKCINLAKPDQVEWMLDEICVPDDAGLIVMLKDPNASLILLELLKVCNNKHRGFLLDKINLYLPRMQGVEHAERLYHSLQQFQSYQNGGRR